MFQHIINIALPLTLVVSVSAHAEPCPTADAIRHEILNCGLNTAATQHAQECTAQVHAEAEALYSKVQNVMTRQSAAEMSAVAQKAVDGVRKMQGEGARIADYTDAMIDAPGSTSHATSLECFNTEFDKIQALVDAMDKDIARVITAIEKLELPKPTH